MRPSTGTGSQTLAIEAPPPVVYARQICSFSNEDATAALVQGADGGQSLVVGGRTWWLFGDTLFLPQSGKQIEQNSIAWSDSRRDDGCPKLNYYARNGIAVPFLPKDGSLTAWPSGAWPVDDHSFDFYTAYVYGSGPYAYWIGEIGLARIETTTMQVRVVSRKLWEGDDGSGQIIGAFPVEIGADGLLRVVLETKSAAGVRELLARVAPADMAEAASYEYWDGARWTASLSDAEPLWSVPDPADPVQKLASFENGASIAWNGALHKYVALVNTSFSSVGAHRGPARGPVVGRAAVARLHGLRAGTRADVLQPATARRAGLRRRRYVRHGEQHRAVRHSSVRAAAGGRDPRVARGA